MKGVRKDSWEVIFVTSRVGFKKSAVNTYFISDSGHNETSTQPKKEEGNLSSAELDFNNRILNKTILKIYRTTKDSGLNSTAIAQ